MPQTNILLETGTNELEIVEFYIDEAHREGHTGPERGYFGINVAKVLEILRMPELTDLPEVSHPAVLGAFNLRNRIIPLVDLARWLRKDAAQSEAPKVIVTEFNRMTTAFLVSGVTRIHRVSWKNVEAPNAYVASLASNSITGVVKIEGRIIYILDMEKIVTELSPRLPGASLADAALGKMIRERGVRVLLVDDSPMVRNMVRDQLESGGMRVTLAGNGRDAMEKLLAWKEQAQESKRSLGDFVQAVVTDVEMPVMDGHSLTMRIKEDSVLRKLPVVLCSSIVSDTQTHKGEAVGANAQVSKAELDTLLETVWSLLN
ncbi:MAG: chemotaxis protein [Desulfovibrionaceae bacterium]